MTKCTNCGSENTNECPNCACEYCAECKEVISN